MEFMRNFNCFFPTKYYRYIDILSSSTNKCDRRRKYNFNTIFLTGIALSLLIQSTPNRFK